MLSLFCFSDDRWSPLHSLWGICGRSRTPFPTRIVRESGKIYLILFSSVSRRERRSFN